MSRGRFGLLLAGLVLVLGIASFMVVFALLDGDAETPPDRGDATDTTLPVTTTTASATTTVPGELATPSFVVVVKSEADEGTAQALRDELTERGYDAGVLHSDDYSSLEPGYWVPYVGPFPSVADADAAKADLVGDGYGAAYSRCVGTTEEC